MHQSPDSKSSDSKTLLRQDLRKKRSALSLQQRMNHDLAIQKHMLTLVQTQGARKIACYWPFNGEPDLIPLCRDLLDEGCEIALPVISENERGSMQFFSWQKDTQLIKNRFGIFEPTTNAPVRISEFDILIIPLVAYDLEGNRVGMGAGYYDRYLEALRTQQAPLRVGAAYSLQELAAIERNKWDIPLHGIVNERGWFTFVE